MGKAAGYILHVRPERLETFENELAHSETFSEPVPHFAHTRGAPLICFLLTDRANISYICRGRKGIVAGTGLRRLNLLEPHRLKRPISIQKLAAELDSRTQSKAMQFLKNGGLISPKAFDSIVEAISHISAESRPLLARFSKQRRELIEKLKPRTKTALGQQKETLLAALAFAGMDKSSVHEWEPPSSKAPTSYLDGLPSAISREDSMIVNDLMNVPGLAFMRSLPYSAAAFEGNGKRLTVLLANRLPLEKLTGTDLIYFNEVHKSFVMVQYKAMDHEDKCFRLPNKDLSKEIARMRAIEKELRKISPAPSKANYRLNSCPFYLKICSRTTFNPDDLKLFPGMYFSLDHWEVIANDESMRGPLEGWRLNYENAGRYVDNNFFITLVANAWIGTHIEQSEKLEKAIRMTIKSGRAVTFAVEAPIPPQK
jgi:hypothetical protein